MRLSEEEGYDAKDKSSSEHRRGVPTRRIRSSLSDGRRRFGATCILDACIGSD